jgi:tetratricopeptide (TPR) repeat protein
MKESRRAADLLHEARAREREACIPEAIKCFEAAISTAERTGERAVLAEAQRRLAVVLHHRNESQRARELCNRSYTVACDLNNDILAAEALNTLGGLALRTGAMEEARRLFQQALERSGTPASRGAGRAEPAFREHQGPAGRGRTARSAVAASATNNEHGSATAYVNLGIVHTMRQYDWADSYFDMIQDRRTAGAIWP